MPLILIALTSDPESNALRRVSGAVVLSVGRTHIAEDRAERAQQRQGV